MSCYHSDATDCANQQLAPLKRYHLLLPILGLLLIWPALVNGGAFLFPDTTAYVRAGDAVALRIAGKPSDWSNSDVYQMAASVQESSIAGRGTGTQSPQDAGSKPRASSSVAALPASVPKPPLLGRSIYYSFIAYAGVLAHSFLLTAMLQALLAGAVVLGALRHAVNPERARRFTFWFVIAILGLAGTSLAYYCSMVMPDFLTGLLIVSAAVLTTGWHRETWLWRSFWLAVATIATLSHSSHVLIAIALSAPLMVVALSRRRMREAGGAATLLLAALFGLLGEGAFVAAVTHMTGQAPIRPPFITARLVEDGSGLAVLAHNCHPASFELCRHVGQLPLASDTFLWGGSGSGIFRSAPAAEQRAIAAEQTRFFFTALTEQPALVFRGSVEAVWRQLGLWRLAEFNYAPEDARGLLSHIPPREAAAVQQTKAYLRVMPVRAAEALTLLGVVLALLLAAFTWRDPPQRRLTGFATVIAAGWFVDVLVCGAMSTPHDRYQARVIWTFTLAACLLAACRWQARDGGSLLDGGAPASESIVR